MSFLGFSLTPGWLPRRLIWAAAGGGALHLTLFLALSQGLLQARPPEPVRLVDLTARLIEPVALPPAPPLTVEAPRPLPQTPPRPAPVPRRAPAPVARQSDQPETRPSPVARPAPLPTVQAPAEETAAPLAQPLPTATAPPTSSPSAAAQASAPTPSRQAAIELPNSQADYLNNPLPLYPKASERLREQGRTVVRVAINASGVPQSADIVESSGFARLDRAAQATAMAWRYVPGRRAGVPEAMAVDVPIVWQLPD